MLSALIASSLLVCAQAPDAPFPHQVLEPIHVFVGDADGDSDPDLLTRSLPGQVLLNTGYGVVRPGGHVTPLPSSWDSGYTLAVTDVDGNGLDDRVTVVQRSRLFPTRTEYAILEYLQFPGNVWTVVQGIAFTTTSSGIDSSSLDFGLVDFTQDGLPDLVITIVDYDYVTDEYFSYFERHENFGGGVFDNDPYPGPRMGPYGSPGLYELVDFLQIDGDSRLDALWSVYHYGYDVLFVYYVAGSSTRELIPDSINLVRPVAPGLADFDGDGDLDIYVGVAESDLPADALLVYWNEGGGTFVAEDYLLGASDHITHVEAGDLDGDGDPDVVATLTSGELRIFRNDPGGFSVVPQDVGMRFSYFNLVDLDGDGDLDISGYWISKNVSTTLYGDGTGRFLPRNDLVVGGRPVRLAAADLDGNGWTDLAAADAAGDGVRLLWNEAGGSWTDGGLLAMGARPLDVDVTDLDGDGLLDLVTADADTTSVSVRLGLGARNFGSATQAALGTHHPSAVAVGDLDGDAIPDLVVASLDGGAFLTLMGAGDGTFGPANETTTPNPGLQGDLDLGDFDGDGDLDVALSLSEDDLVAIFANDGSGVFTLAASHPARRPTGILWADLDVDGNLDLAWNDHGSAQLTILQGDGAGGLTLSDNHPVGVRPGGLDVADTNLDGIPDLLVAQQWTDSVGVLTGEGGVGGIAMRPVLFFHAPRTPRDVVAADFDGDGKPDFAVALPDTGIVSIYPNLMP